MVLTDEQRREELARVASGDCRPVCAETLPVGHPDNGFLVPLTRNPIDDERRLRMDALVHEGLLRRDPMRW